MAELTKEKIQEIVRSYVREVLEEDAEYRAVSKPRTRDKIEAQEEGLWSVQGDTREALALNDYSMADSLITRWELLRKHGIDGVGKSDASYRMLCRAMMEGFLDIGEVLLAREVGDHNKEREIVAQLFPPMPALQQAKPVEAEDFGIPLSEVIASLIRRKVEADKEWKPKTEDKRRKHFALFQEFLGGEDMGIKSIDRATISAFKNALVKLPPNRNKSPKWKGKSIKHLLALDLPEDSCMSRRTAIDILSSIKLLFSDARMEGLISTDPSEGLKIKDPNADEEKRTVFTTAELRAIFNHPGYTADTFDLPYQFWCPIIALYTGGRANEIASLHLRDFTQVDGVWCIDIYENKAEDKSVKTKAGRRRVPLHPFLVDDLGLMHYVEKLRKRGCKRLFPELSYGADGYWTSGGKWFNDRFRPQCGIKKPKRGEPKKDFHSFRHTCITQMELAGVNDYVKKRIVGHSIKDITAGTYTHYTPKHLYEEGTLKLSYDLDLSHLKASKYSGNR
ncbi:site-specific integrase [Desulfatibacillum aliphaticivorans]|nr:site-specific integrase [Desulfatibacillum aliphaticivorans]